VPFDDAQDMIVALFDKIGDRDAAAGVSAILALGSADVGTD
jgi:hypothetical protein